METSADVMIVDDNINNLKMLERILLEAGYAVFPALSGALALNAIDASPPDLILLDIRMPGLSGYETCKRIKSREQTRDIPIIFISALNDIEDKLAAFREGGVDYVTKPFQSEEVLARVKTQIELADARKALVESHARLLGMMDQLVQSEKMKSLGSFAAGVAHELNTPVGNALLTASAIDSITDEFSQAHVDATEEVNELVSTCRDCAKIIQRNLERAAKLIASLREMTVDQASERRRRIVLRDTVNDVITMMKFSLGKTPYAMVNEIEPELSIETFPGHLEQILDNLIRNAVIHGFDGAGQGTITLSAQKKSANEIELVVADNGKGIPAEHLRRVFDPFFTTKLGQGGSGLGLHIVFNLAGGVLGGGVTVSSEPGTGTRFTLTLPTVAPGG